jgi:hypothetical protein
MPDKEPLRADALANRGRILDAACGTGKYFGMVLDAGRLLAA